jgi:hypothetical protein
MANVAMIEPPRLGRPVPTARQRQAEDSNEACGSVRRSPRPISPLADKEGWARRALLAALAEHETGDGAWPLH